MRIRRFLIFLLFLLTEHCHTHQVFHCIQHFFDGSHFFRAIPKFLVQFGISYSEDKELQKFAKSPIPDDPVHDPKIVFHPGIISYAGSGPNSRTSQMFISYGSAASLGKSKAHDGVWKLLDIRVLCCFESDAESRAFLLMALLPLIVLCMVGTQPWETPIGKVIEGYENAEQFYSYGDMPPWGKGKCQTQWMK